MMTGAGGWLVAGQAVSSAASDLRPGVRAGVEYITQLSTDALGAAAGDISSTTKNYTNLYEGGCRFSNFTGCVGRYSGFGGWFYPPEFDMTKRPPPPNPPPVRATAV